MLKLYHVKLPDNNNFLGYDSYSEFVCTAYTEQEARNIHPSGSDGNWSWYGSWIKLEQIDILEVTEIGIATPGTQPHKVIVASFHAG